MKLEIKNNRKTGKFRNMLILNNILLSNQKIKEEIKGEFKMNLRKTKMETQHMRTFGM